MESPAEDTTKPEPYSDEDIAARGGAIAANTEKRTLRTISRLLEPLVNPKNFVPPEASKEPFILYFEMRGSTVFLREDKSQHFRNLVETILGIPEVGDVVGQEGLSEILTSLIQQEIEGRKFDGSKTPLETLREDVFRRIAASLDWYRFYFVLRGIEIEGSGYQIGPATVFMFDDEWIENICRPSHEVEGHENGFLEDTKEFMKKNLKKRPGLTFPMTGDDHQSMKNAELTAKRCVDALRFACCLLYPDHAAVDQIHIDIADSLSGPPVLIFCASQRVGHLSQCSEIPRHGVLRFALNNEAQEILQESGFGDLLNLCFFSNLSELEEAILRSMEWIGDAYGDLSLAAAFSKYWFAIETLVSTRRDGVTEYLKRSIPVLLAYGGHQFIKEEQIQQIAKRVSQLYDLRSGAVHRGVRVFSDEDLATVREYACFVLLTYLSLRKLNYVSHKQINAETDLLYLKSLSYVAKKGARRYHRATCSWVKRFFREPLKPFRSPTEAEKDGLKPCKSCLGGLAGAL